MLPDNELSTSAVISGFAYPVKSPSPADLLQDWELAGVGLNDASEGMLVQVWRGILDIDAAGVGSVYVEAPNTPKTFMFDGAGITEIDIAFDQNMRPAVAYMQAGVMKLWWYDSAAAAMVVKVFPGSCRDPRMILDEKRPFNIADSDMVLSYMNGSDLCVSYQRDRFLVETVLKAGAGPNARLISMSLNRGHRIQFRLRNYELTDDLGALLQADPFVGDVVLDLCERAGIDKVHVDVTELYDDFVPGLKVAIDTGLDEPIGWLGSVFLFDKAQYNDKLFFPKRGRPVVMRIPFDHLVDDGAENPLKQTLVDPNSLPRVVNLNYIDPVGGFAENHQTAQRRSNLITSNKTENIDSKLVLYAQQASDQAWSYLKAKHNEQYDYEFKTSIRYTALTPGDVIEVEDGKGAWHRVRIEEKNEDSGVISWEAKQDAGSLAYDTVETLAVTVVAPVSTTPGLVGDTELEILNLPVQRDQDDELGLYIAANGTSSGWTGYSLLYSVDAGTTYQTAFTSATGSNIGETSTSVTTGDTTVDVLMPYPMESVTTGQLDLGYNRAVMGDEEVQFQTAALVGRVGVLYHYTLTGMRRAVLRDVAEPWAAGIRFVVLDESVIFARIQREFLGTDLYYKAVSTGQSADEVTPVAYLFDKGHSQEEWAVGNVVVAPNPDGLGFKTTWEAAPRLGTFGSAPYESKYFRGYRLKYSGGAIFDVPPGTLSHTYTDAPADVTVEIFSLNEITGESALKGSGSGTGASGSAVGGSTPNFPANPGFESDLTNWSVRTAPSVVSSTWAVITDGARAHSGSKFLRWTGNSAPSGGGGGPLEMLTYYNDTKTDSPGTDFLLVKVWARCSRSAIAPTGLVRARIGIQRFNTSDVELGNTVSGTVSLFGSSMDSGWVQIDVFAAKDPDVAYFKAFVEAQGPEFSTVEFDDLDWNGTVYVP